MALLIGLRKRANKAFTGWIQSRKFSFLVHLAFSILSIGHAFTVRYLIYRWWTKILSVTNDTTFYVGYFFSFWRIPIGWLTGQILTPIYIGCYFFVYFATKKKKKKTYVKSSSEKILVHGQAVFAFALPSKQIIILYLLLDIFILKNMF